MEVAELTNVEMDDIADRLIRALSSADLDEVREVYAPDATIWHNFDQRDQTVDENLAGLVDLHERAGQLRYTEIRRFLAPGGFVQQHVLVGMAKGGPLSLPAMVRFWVEGGRITRLEEYLDTHQARVLYGA